MEKYDEKPDSCSFRGRRLSKNLHECITNHTSCQYRYSFGNGYYCSTLEIDRTDQRGRNIFLEEDSYGHYDR